MVILYTYTQLFQYIGLMAFLFLIDVGVAIAGGIQNEAVGL